ncbi:MAG: glycoside hydrolase family 5 protein [Chlorobi bacterium]|nr:glycoside hydrolase family 5 protein [Chlorobiota bacterium]
MNAHLARTVNLGNALEAPHEGDWGMIIRKEYIDSIAAAGFTAVRIPIKWSAHADKVPPYTVDPAFFTRIDEVVGWCLDAGLNAIIDFHHYDELTSDPESHKERWLAIWRQISQHFSNAPDSIFFELLNEPHDALTADLWNRYLAEAIDLIRKDNPTRILIAGPVQWNAFDKLNTLVLPQDTLLIATFHYYLPFHFTHQGAEWVDGSNAWMGTTWTATDEEKQNLEDDFETAASWGQTYNRPLFLGEFGAYSKADSLSRILWTTFVRETAESKGISWAYWEFGAGFGIYDRGTNSWRDGLLNALIPH